MISTLFFLETPSSMRPKILQSFRREKTATPNKKSNDDGSNLRIDKRAIETQTDWSWIQDMQLIERFRRG